MASSQLFSWEQRRSGTSVEERNNLKLCTCCPTLINIAYAIMHKELSWSCSSELPPAGAYISLSTYIHCVLVADTTLNFFEETFKELLPTRIPHHIKNTKKAMCTLMATPQFNSFPIKCRVGASFFAHSDECGHAFLRESSIKARSA